MGLLSRFRDLILIWRSMGGGQRQMYDIRFVYALDFLSSLDMLAVVLLSWCKLIHLNADEIRMRSSLIRS